LQAAGNPRVCHNLLQVQTSLSSGIVDMPAVAFHLDSKVQGYHIYQAIWKNPCTGDELICEREIGNSHDPQSVAMKKETDGIMSIVGHVPHEISSTC